MFIFVWRGANHSESVMMLKMEYKETFKGFSSFIVHCSLFIVHCSLFIVHCSLFIVHCSLFIVQ